MGALDTLLNLYHPLSVKSLLNEEDRPRQLLALPVRRADVQILLKRRGGLRA
jgi:hypothetical protein